MNLRTLLRPWWRNPALTVTALAVLGLGIGANTAIFSIVRAVLLKPLPYTEPHRIAVLAETYRNGAHFNVSGADFEDWRRQSSSFTAMASYFSEPQAVMAGGEAERIETAAVNTGWFAVMGARPQIGRLFDPSEEKPNSSKAALIGDSLWKRRFNANPGVLGAKLKFQGELYTVVGVLPPGFRFPGKADLWVPLGLFPDESERSAHNYRVVGRLKPGVTVEQAQAEMSTIAARLAGQYPDSNRDIGAAVIPLQTELTSEAGPTLYLLLVAVGLVLLIACANVGNLLLAQGARRRGELAIRTALGADRKRLVFQLVSESVALSLAGGLLGLALAWWAKDLLVRLAPGDIPRLGEAAIDYVVLAFGVLVSLVTGLLFGLAPALRISRGGLVDALKLGSARAGIGGAGARSRAVLVCAEIALSVVLVTAAGLAVRSLVALQRVPTGYDTRNVLVLDMSVPVADNDESRRQAVAVYADFLRRAQTIPGVVAAGAVTSVPLSELGSSNGSFLKEDNRPDRSQTAGFHTVTGGYFRTLSIPLREGRDFDDRDALGEPRVAVISETMARKYWPSGDAVGHRISTGYDRDSGNMTIVGIVGDVRHLGLDRAPRPEIYVPVAQHQSRAVELSAVVKTAGDPSALIDPLRAELHQVDAEVPVSFTTFDEVAARSIGSPRFRGLLLGAFAALALALAIVGVYGLMAFLAAQRTPEIGLRMALGATSSNVLALVMGRSMLLIGAGLAIGVAASLALTRYMESMLYGVRAADPLTYAGVCLALLLSAGAASLLPAWRASRIDPLKALRTE